ncbi:MAG: hypothetical protein ACI8TL_000678 [Natronomonas sp.]|jgi:hypothetical protein
MPSRSNKHIKKFNQLVEVYEPDGIEPIETVTSNETESLQARRAELSGYRPRIEELGPAEFFGDERETEISETESLPDPATVARSQREEMLDRFDLIEEALAETVDDGEVLDTSEDLDW